MRRQLVCWRRFLLPWNRLPAKTRDLAKDTTTYYFAGFKPVVARRIRCTHPRVISRDGVAQDSGGWNEITGAFFTVLTPEDSALDFPAAYTLYMMPFWQTTSKERLERELDQHKEFAVARAPFIPDLCADPDVRQLCIREQFLGGIFGAKKSWLKHNNHEEFSGAQIKATAERAAEIAALDSFWRMLI